MTTLVISPPSVPDEGFFSANSEGSESPSSLHLEKPSLYSEQRKQQVDDHELITLAKSAEAEFFFEQGHLVYLPCTHCTLLYQEKKDASLSKFEVKHRNHTYINHWVFLRCCMCKDAALKPLSCHLKSSECNRSCPLHYLKIIAHQYIKHGLTCPGGSSCSYLTLNLNDYSCCNKIAFEKTILKAPTLSLNMKERLSVLPQVALPARAHIRHDCATDPCVDYKLLQEALQKIDCQLIGKISHGVVSRIYKILNKSNKETLYLKAVCLHDIAKNNSCRSVDIEISICMLNHHENVPVLFHYGTFRLADTVYMVSPEMKNGNLEEYLVGAGNLTEETYRRMIIKICKGLQFLHTHWIAHRNLNLHNILVGGGATDLKISGFGSSCVIEPGRLITYPMVSYIYAAPEFFQTRHFDPLKPDIWALGIIMYFLFNRKQLFPNSCISQPRSEICHWDFSSESKTFFDFLMIRKFENRPDINTILKHNWLSNKE